MASIPTPPPPPPPVDEKRLGPDGGVLPRPFDKLVYIAAEEKRQHALARVLPTGPPAIVVNEGNADFAIRPTTKRRVAFMKAITDTDTSRRAILRGEVTPTTAPPPPPLPGKKAQAWNAIRFQDELIQTANLRHHRRYPLPLPNATAGVLLLQSSSAAPQPDVKTAPVPPATEHVATANVRLKDELILAVAGHRQRTLQPSDELHGQLPGAIAPAPPLPARLPVIASQNLPTLKEELPSVVCRTTGSRRSEAQPFIATTATIMACESPPPVSRGLVQVPIEGGSGFVDEEAPPAIRGGQASLQVIEHAPIVEKEIVEEHPVERKREHHIQPIVHDIVHQIQPIIKTHITTSTQVVVKDVDVLLPPVYEPFLTGRNPTCTAPPIPPSAPVCVKIDAGSPDVEGSNPEGLVESTCPAEGEFAATASQERGSLAKKIKVRLTKIKVKPTLKDKEGSVFVRGSSATTSMPSLT